MTSMYILFVEDNERMIDSFETTIQEWNDANNASGKKFKTKVARTSDEAILFLDDIRFDAVVVDLRLPKVPDGQEDASHGNELAHSTICNRGVPIVIVSGNVAELSPELVEMDTVKCLSKGKGYVPAVDWLSEQWDMMHTLKLARRELESASAAVFAKRLWPQWCDIAKLNSANTEDLYKIVSRQYAGHISDYFGTSSEENADWHPYENYVIPSMIEDRAHTGDLFKIDDDVWIVLSPQCDMANRMIGSALLARCETAENQAWSQDISLIKNEGAKQKSKEKAVERIRQTVNQNISKKKHFLPPLPGTTDPIFVDFSNLQTMEVAYLDSILGDRMATVSSPFLGNLIQRFGAFMTRTGQPDLAVEHFLDI